MNFIEALQALKKNKKIRLHTWEPERFLQLDNEKNIVCWQRHILPYNYDASILLCDEWLKYNDPTKQPHTFMEAMHHVKDGGYIYLKEWAEDRKVGLHKDTHELVFYTYIPHMFTLPFNEFFSHNWEILP